MHSVATAMVPVTIWWPTPFERVVVTGWSIWWAVKRHSRIIEPARVTPTMSSTVSPATTIPVRTAAESRTATALKTIARTLLITTHVGDEAAGWAGRGS